ncbi:MAG: hypothetical protein JWR04_3174 [Rhodoglobus sp.]|nr:hypothetical protein [Rhodoglobus sp.]
MLVPGRTAAELDIWGRAAWVLALLIGIVALFLTPPASFVLAGVSLAAIVSAVVLGLRSSRVVKLEKDAGYSTLFDFAGYELRNPRTKELLRAAEVAPANLGRRSVLRSMLTVKPGTVLAKRLEGDE